jgi:hypothetical protein
MVPGYSNDDDDGAGHDDAAHVNPSDRGLVAHSVHEAELYLRVAICTDCGKGPAEVVREIVSEPPGNKRQICGGSWTWLVRCKRCNEESELVFERSSSGLPDLTERGAKLINASNEPSELIDLNQWLGLFQHFLEASESEADKQAARSLLFEAVGCLEEALKFYPEDSAEQLPPASSFFHPVSLKRFQEHPEVYSRERWEERHRRLPPLKSLELSAVSK